MMRKLISKLQINGNEKSGFNDERSVNNRIIVATTKYDGGRGDQVCISADVNN